jgi:V8-like Glu-specific endopeptidase
MAVWAAPTASAIVNGTPDTTHNAVGSFWITNPSTGRNSNICTGVYVAPTVFVTASHCSAFLVDLGWVVHVSRAPVTPTDGSLPTDAVRADVHLNPAYKTAKGTDSYNHDVSVLITRTDDGGPVARLPRLGLLDDMKADKSLRDATFTLVGYGTSARVMVKGEGATFPRSPERQLAVLGFHSLSRTVLHEDQRANAGYGGACYGDSGGPSFLNDTDIVVGVTSTGDIPCYSTNTAYRLDTPEAREFLDDFVTLP